MQEPVGTGSPLGVALSGVEVSSIFQDKLRLTEASLTQKHDPSAVVGVGVVGICLRGAAEGFESVRELALCQEDGTQIVVGFRVIRGDFNRFAEGVFGSVEFALLQVG